MSVGELVPNWRDNMARPDRASRVSWGSWVTTGQALCLFISVVRTSPFTFSCHALSSFSGQFTVEGVHILKFGGIKHSVTERVRGFNPIFLVPFGGS